MLKICCCGGSGTILKAQLASAFEQQLGMSAKDSCSRATHVLTFLPLTDASKNVSDCVSNLSIRSRYCNHVPCFLTCVLRTLFVEGIVTSTKPA